MAYDFTKYITSDKTESDCGWSRYLLVKINTNSLKLSYIYHMRHSEFPRHVPRDLKSFAVLISHLDLGGRKTIPQLSSSAQTSATKRQSRWVLPISSILDNERKPEAYFITNVRCMLCCGTLPGYCTISYLPSLCSCSASPDRLCRSTTVTGRCLLGATHHPAWTSQVVEQVVIPIPS